MAHGALGGGQGTGAQGRRSGQVQRRREISRDYAGVDVKGRQPKVAPPAGSVARQVAWRLQRQGVQQRGARQRAHGRRRPVVAALHLEQAGRAEAVQHVGQLPAGCSGRPQRVETCSLLAVDLKGLHQGCHTRQQAQPGGHPCTGVKRRCVGDGEREAAPQRRLAVQHTRPALPHQREHRAASRGQGWVMPHAGGPQRAAVAAGGGSRRGGSSSSSRPISALAAGAGGSHGGRAGGGVRQGRAAIGDATAAAGLPAAGVQGLDRCSRRSGGVRVCWVVGCWAPDRRLPPRPSLLGAAAAAAAL